MNDRAAEGKPGAPQLGLPRREEWGLAAPRRGGPWPALVFIALLGVIALQVALLLRSAAAPNAPPSSGAGAGPFEGIRLKDLSARLQRNNLPGAAARVLEDHFRALPPDQVDERRRTLVALGSLLQKAGRHEEALVRYYQAEALDPDGETQRTIDLAVTECLEKLGKHDELAYELADRTAPGRKPGLPSAAGDQAAGKVVAQIGIDTITASDLDGLIGEEVDRRLAAAPHLAGAERETVRARILKDLQAPQKRLDLLHQFVVRRILYREGVERELDRTSAVQEELARAREDLVARAVMEEKEREIRITEGDVRLFFQASAGRYARKASARARAALFADEAAARAAMEGAKTEDDFARAARESSIAPALRESGGLLPEPVTEGEPFPALGSEPELTAAVLAAEAGGPIPRPVKAARGYAIAWVIEKTPAHSPAFEEVKEEVARDYYERKRAEVFQALQEELFRKHAVVIHNEAFLEAPPGEKEEEKKAENPGSNGAKDAKTDAEEKGEK